MALKVIPQQKFQNCFQQWQHCWAKHIAVQTEYFKGDPSHWAVCMYTCMLAIKSFLEL